jgi:hypothetical protein
MKVDEQPILFGKQKIQVIYKVMQVALSTVCFFLWMMLRCKRCDRTHHAGCDALHLSWAIRTG